MMKLVTLLDRANEGYADGFLANYYTRAGHRKAGNGDILAEFIVRELTETFDDAASDIAQLNEAGRALEAAREDIEGVIDALNRG
jgi:hypothetical protein